MTSFGRILEIWRYPVSSMSGESLPDAALGEGGIAHDRVWGIRDTASGEVAAPENRKPWRPLPNLSARMAAGGPEIAAGDGVWLPAASPEAEVLASGFLGFPVELRPHGADGAAGADAVSPRYERADIHLLTTASMRTLAALLEDPQEVHPRRFRPNLVVETDPEFEGLVEQGMVGRVLAIGDARIEISEPCARCTFTALAQGHLAFKPAVLHAISRHGAGGFGALCKVRSPARIRVGDPVRLIAPEG